jgi:hypothetical protein
MKQQAEPPRVATLARCHRDLRSAVPAGGLTERVRLFPILFTYGIGIAVLVSIAAVAYLIDLMVRRSEEVGGLKLLASSICGVVTNVLVFSLLYWQINRGGPARGELIDERSA